MHSKFINTDSINFSLRAKLLIASSAAMTSLLCSSGVIAQEGADAVEEVLVSGTRQVIRDAISIKRLETEIVDGLSADEIGDIPALSIGEALETITGASSHRENGGATEVSIRGLGPFLTNTVINGRGATNGAGNRAVNFSIFPSELFNKIGIYKTQSAGFIEGAVGGQILLDTKSPLDYGKKSTQLSGKLSHNENGQDILGGDKTGFRTTASHINQFETEDMGSFGISLGIQVRDETNPEQEYRTSGTPRICDLTSDGVPIGRTCSDAQNFLRGLTPGLGNDGDPTTFATDADRETFAFLSSSATFRQNITDDERSAFFGAFQWQPNDNWNINLDTQLSERIQSERRTDLVFAELNRNINQPTTVISSNGVLQSFENAGQEIQLLSQDFVRDEEYQGLGLGAEYQVNDRLQVSGDISYSNTYRLETEEGIRLADEIERSVSADLTNQVPTFVVADFNPTDLGEFLSTSTPGVFTPDSIAAALNADGNADDRLRARAQNDIRENTLRAARGDFVLDTENFGAVKSIEGGVRYSELEYERRGNINRSVNLRDLAGGSSASDAQSIVLANIANNCVDTFRESGFLSEELDGRPLVIGANGQGFNAFPSIDSGCAFDLLRAAGLDLEANSDFNGSSIDVQEDTIAAYMQANYESQLFGYPARGNFGVRVVHTAVGSRTFQSAFQIDQDDEGFEIDPDNSDIINTINDVSSYTEVLPSASLVLDLRDDVLFRAGLFRGISRSDPALLGERQALGSVFQSFLDTTDTSAGNESLPTLVEIQTYISNQATTGGSAQLEPFTSWNADLALEWYPNEDTILAAGAYYKKFKGGYQNAVANRTFIIVEEDSGETLVGRVDGIGANGEVVAPVNILQTTDDTSSLYGLELTASHAFSYLPGYLSGFGAKLSYNYAESDFEFEDDFSGAGVGVNDAGEQVNLIGLTAPAEIFGLSRNVASAQLYWSGGDFDAQAIFKHRSQYFQQFIDTPARIRYVDDNSVLEFRASYKLNKHVKLSFEALNITDEPRVDYRGIDGNINQVLSYGPRYFIGIKAKF